MAIFELSDGIEALKEYEKACSYGEILIKFEHGKIVFIKESKVRRPKKKG